MTNTLRWGILSTAAITEAMIVALRGAPRSTLTAVASRDARRARGFADKNDIATAYGSYEELLEDSNIDAVYLPLPNALHSEWAVKAAQSGKHVLVEKPIATRVEDLDEIQGAARDNQVVVFEAFMSLHSSQNRRVLELINEGRIGEVRLINSWFSYFLPPGGTDDIRLSRELHGGSFWDVGVYPNSLSITMAGGEAPVQVSATREMGETGVDVEMAGQLRFANGAIAQIYSGWRSPFVEGAQIIGSEGVIRISQSIIPGMATRSDAGPDTVIRIEDADGKEERIVVPASNPWQKEVEAMEACVFDGAEPVVPLSLSREFLRSAVAVHESARACKAIDL